MNECFKPFTITDSFFIIRGCNCCIAVKFTGKNFKVCRITLCAVASPKNSFCAKLHNQCDGLRSNEAEMFNNFSPITIGGLPLRCASSTDPISRNFSVKTMYYTATRYRCSWESFSRKLPHYINVSKDVLIKKFTFLT